jgi:peptide/nickel transport system substrate-binding protein
MLKSCQLAATLLLSFAYPCVAARAQTQPAPAQIAGKTANAPLIIAVSGAPRTLDAATATDAAGARLLQLTHPALLTWNDTYQPIGHLAAGCTQPTLTTATCTLAPGRTFTDGTPVTAPAVASWFTQLQANPLSPFTPLKGVSVTAPNPTTVRFELPSPTLSFLGALTEIPVANPAAPAIGGGPYRITAHDTLGTVTLSTSDTTLPASITFTPISDATTRLLKLKKGEVDAVLNDLPPQLVDWAQKQGFPVVAVPGTSYSYLGLNLTNPILARPSVREAIALAINRPAIRKFLLGGMAEPASTLLPPGHPAAWPAPEEPFDPFTAEGLLDDANLLRGPDNSRTTLTLLTSTDPFSQRVSQAIQSQLAGIGITLQLRPTEWASFYDAVKKGNFDMVMLAWTGEQQPSFYYHAFNARQMPPIGLNRGRLNNQRINALTDRIMAAQTTAEQTEATLQTQKDLADLRPYIPLYRRHQILVTRPGITGCKLPPSGAYIGLLACKK